MTTTDLKPIPTDYRGVRFRSKSEAIFVRNLELIGYTIWEYEPRFYRLSDGWSPDFWAVGQNFKKHIILSLLIEYKPSNVTDAYLDKARDRFRILAAHGHLKVVACGNSFNQDRKTFVLENDGTWNEIESQIKLFKCITEASRHRFDLA